MHRWARWAIPAMLAAAAPAILIIGYAIGLSRSVEADDLLPGRIRACESEVVVRITNANLLAADAYTPAELDAIKTLSGPCYADNVYPELNEVQLGLLERSPIGP